MNREAQLAAEAQVLGTLCNGTGVREQRNELANILGHYAFLEPEHEIVFGSIRSLLVHDRLSNTRLAKFSSLVPEAKAGWMGTVMTFDELSK